MAHAGRPATKLQITDTSAQAQSGACTQSA